MTQRDLLSRFPGVTFCFLDGFDEALLGCDVHSKRTVYSVRIIIEILCREMSMREAMTELRTEILAMDQGEFTPVWLDDYQFERGKKSKK